MRRRRRRRRRLTFHGVECRGVARGCEQASFFWPICPRGNAVWVISLVMERFDATIDSRVDRTFLSERSFIGGLGSEWDVLCADP